MAMQRTILVVDDNPDVCWALLTCLSLERYKVNIAHDCVNALASVSSAPPGLILLDYRMPGMAAFEFVRRAREQLGEDTTIILFTAAQNPVRLAKKLRLKHVLQKPIDTTELKAVCKELLRAA